MDIVRKIKPIKASFDNLGTAYKLGLIVILISLSSLIVPHGSVNAAGAFNDPFIFVVNDHAEFVADANKQATNRYNQMLLGEKLNQQRLLKEKVEKYLRSNNSPLSEYAESLIKLPNWKKIIALSNAESNMCKKYPQSTNNCWGVGGSTLWDMGDNLGEGVVAMDRFLIAHPKQSKTKYSNMTFEQMNGLYKQPAADHWVFNNQVVYDDLVAIEKSI